MTATPLTDLITLLRLAPTDVVVEGAEPPTSSPHRLAECTAAAMAVHGAAGARLAELRGGPHRTVSVRTEDALLQLMAVFATRVGDVPVATTMEDPNLLGDSAFYRCADGREVFLLLSYPHLRDRALRVLGCAPDRAAIVEAVARWRAGDLEEAVVATGGTATMVRTAAEWAASDAGRSIAGDPVVRVARTGHAAPRHHRVLRSDDAPMAGLRVLDLTHVIAGPVGARLAAEHGAEVLHVSRADRPDPNAMIIETGTGKRNAYCDLRTDAGRSALHRVLDGADVVLHSYRDMARFGLDADQLAAEHPGVVFADVHGWGAGGPWAGRGGFDQLACAATGFALEEGGGDHASLPPTYLLNDYVAAFLLSAGIQTALARQISEGGSWHVHVDLARVCTWVQASGANPNQRDDADGDLRDRLDDVDLVVRTGPFGAVRSVAPRVRTVPAWDSEPRPSAPLGSSALEWEH